MESISGEQPQDTRESIELLDRPNRTRNDLSRIEILRAWYAGVEEGDGDCDASDDESGGSSSPSSTASSAPSGVQSTQVENSVGF